MPKQCKIAASQCGNSCISAKKTCRISAQPAVVEQINKLTDRIASAKPAANTAPAPAPAPKQKQFFGETIVDEDRDIEVKLKHSKTPDAGLKSPDTRELAIPKMLRDQKVKNIFDGDEAKAKAFENKVSKLLQEADLKPNVMINKESHDKAQASDGRLKNLYEFKGNNEQKLKRLQYESQMLGYDSKGDLANNPKSGFLATSNEKSMQQYGDSVLRNGKFAPDQYTVTFGDSLTGLVGSNINDINIASFDNGTLAELAKLPELKLADILERVPYIETQLAGRVNLSDFDELEPAG
jgi:hypothetical protein